jgi:hypothetical protein
MVGTVRRISHQARIEWQMAKESISSETGGCGIMTTKKPKARKRTKAEAILEKAREEPSLRSSTQTRR